MKVYSQYLKIAILLVGVFWMWDWGREGSETLTPRAFALADSLGRAEAEAEFLGFEPGIIQIQIKEEDEISAAIFSASQAGETVTGIASFDSISQKYGLIHLSGASERSSWYKLFFTLLFPEEVDHVSVLIAYNDLPYVEFVDVAAVYFASADFPMPPYSALTDSIYALLDSLLTTRHQ